jgi:hypothetical protein
VFRRTVMLLGCLVVPRVVAADTIVSFADALVTWEARGVIGQSGPTFHPKFPVIPVGTPFTLSVTFNPNAASPTVNAPYPDCLTVGFSGSLTLGSTTYGGSGFGFTNAMLPGSNCQQTDLTQFTLLGGTSAEGVSLQSVYGTSIIVASYRDLLVQDAFPDAPTGTGFFFMNRWDHGGNVNGSFTWQVVDADPPAPVPEPGTLTLFALGAAAVARSVRARRRSLDR